MGGGLGQQPMSMDSLQGMTPQQQMQMLQQKVAQQQLPPPGMGQPLTQQAMQGQGMNPGMQFQQPMGGGPMGGGPQQSGLGALAAKMGGGLGQTPTPMNGGFGQPIGGGAKNAFS